MAVFASRMMKYPKYVSITKVTGSRCWITIDGIDYRNVVSNIEVETGKEITLKLQNGSLRTGSQIYVNGQLWKQNNPSKDPTAISMSRISYTVTRSINIELSYETDSDGDKYGVMYITEV